MSPLVKRPFSPVGEKHDVPESFRSEHPHVAWRAMAGMRDRLIHGYLGVDYALAWDVVSTRIPELRDQISSILNGRQDR